MQIVGMQDGLLLEIHGVLIHDEFGLNLGEGHWGHVLLQYLGDYLDLWEHISLLVVHHAPLKNRVYISTPIQTVIQKQTNNSQSIGFYLILRLINLWTAWSGVCHVFLHESSVQEESLTS